MPAFPPRPLEADNLRRINLIRQTDVHAFPEDGKPLVLTGLMLKRQTPTQARDGNTPFGFRAKSWEALLSHFETFSGDVKLDYKQINVLLTMLCGDPVETTININGVPCVKRDFYMLDGELDALVHYAVENGYINACKRMLYSLMSAWSMNVKRGNQTGISSSTTLMFNPPQKNGDGNENFPMTASIAQNSKLRVTAVNVVGGGVFLIQPLNIDAESITIAPGDTEAQIEAKFLAAGMLAEVSGTIVEATGEKHKLIATNATGNATIYGDIVVTPGMTAAALQALVRTKFGNNGINVTGGTSTIHGTEYKSFTTIKDKDGVALNQLKDGANNVPAFAWSNNKAILDFGAVKTVTSILVHHYANGSDTIRVRRANNADLSDAVLVSDTPISSGGSVTINIGQNCRYLELSPLQNNSEIYEVYITGPAQDSNGAYEIQHTFGQGNVPDITSTPGTNWTTEVTNMGNASGVVNIEILDPEELPVTINKTSPVNDGYTAIVTQHGSDGTLRLPEEFPILPHHFGFYKSDTLLGLNNAVALKGVHETDLSITNVVEPDQVFAEGQLGYQNHVPGDPEIVHKTILVSDELQTESDCREYQKDADESKATWKRNRARHPDGLHSFFYEGRFAPSQPIAPRAGGKVFQYEYTESLHLNDELLTPDGKRAMLHFATTEPI